MDPYGENPVDFFLRLIITQNHSLSTNSNNVDGQGNGDLGYQASVNIEAGDNNSQG